MDCLSRIIIGDLKKSVLRINCWDLKWLHSYFFGEILRSLLHLASVILKEVDSGSPWVWERKGEKFKLIVVQSQRLGPDLQFSSVTHSQVQPFATL